jgi:hypothetical protein
VSPGLRLRLVLVVEHEASSALAGVGRIKVPRGARKSLRSQVSFAEIWRHGERSRAPAFMDAQLRIQFRTRKPSSQS